MLHIYISLSLCLSLYIYMLLGWVLKYLQILYHLAWLTSLSLYSVAVQLLSHVWILRPHGLYYTRFPCPSSSPGACSNSCTLSCWCHPTISSSVITFSCLQFFPASGSFPVSQLFISGGQNIEASASASVLLMNIQGWSPLGLTGLISLQSKGLWSLLQQHSSKASTFWHSAFFMVQIWHPYMTTGKTIALIIQTFVGKVMSLLCNMLFRLAIVFLPRSKHPLISWLQSPSAVILEPKKIKSFAVSIVSPSIFHEITGPDAWS